MLETARNMSNENVLSIYLHLFVSVLFSIRSISVRVRCEKAKRT